MPARAGDFALHAIAVYHGGGSILQRFTMAGSFSLSELDLAALLCSRVCHDVISPVGAITNGLEVLEDDNDEQMRGFAMDLIKKSAVRASASLQFARLAYGAAGSAGAELDLGELRDVACGFAESDKISVTWNASTAAVEKEFARLLLNLVVIALHAIPRGGTIAVDVNGPGDGPNMMLRCSGTDARVPEHANELIAGEPPAAAVDARSIQPYFTGLLARQVGANVEVAMNGDDVMISAVPRQG